MSEEYNVELPRTPMWAIEQAVGYKTLHGRWPNGFDVDVLVIQLVHDLTRARDVEIAQEELIVKLDTHADLTDAEKKLLETCHNMVERRRVSEELQGVVPQWTAEGVVGGPTPPGIDPGVLLELTKMVADGKLGLDDVFVGPDGRHYKVDHVFPEGGVSAHVIELEVEMPADDEQESEEHELTIDPFSLTSLTAMVNANFCDIGDLVRDRHGNAFRVIRDDNGHVGYELLD